MGTRYAIHSSNPGLPHSFPDHFPSRSVAEQFEEEDDPEACLDESPSATHEYELASEEAKTSTSTSMTDYSVTHSGSNTYLSLLDSESMFASQGVKENEVLYTPAAKYTPNSEFPTFYTYNYNSNVIYFMAVASTAEEYWNSESEDGYRSSYFDMINDVDLLLPLTNALRPTTIVADSESREVETSTNDNFNQAFDLMTASIAASGDPSHNVTAATENTDMSWPSMASHSNSPSVLGTSASAYNSDFMPVDTSDQSYPYPNMDYLAHFSFVPTASAATHSSQPNNLFLPPPTQVVHSFHSNSPNIVPEDSNRAPHNLNKRLRISDFTEENILPDNERRKRSKPERLIL